MVKSIKLSLAIFLSLAVIGCATVPTGFLKPGEACLEKRSMQSRQYDTINEEQILSAVAGVLQDLNFTLDDSETKLGLVSASKKASAVSKGQVAGAVLIDVLGALGGVSSNSTKNCDKSQIVKASVTARPSLDGKRTVVRVTFQRIVWNMDNQVS
ncbi:MAG: hypothetical protein PHR73_02335, partial [Candidatus Omnitrophica bacterium]|nr:hypothetical protein [Candidatus Omnitrophota bacterium]